MIGYARLAGIPAFLAVALSSRHGHSVLAAVLFAVIGWSDYLDGFVARLTGHGAQPTDPPPLGWTYRDASAMNAFNRPLFSAPNTQYGAPAFGTIASQANNPRQIQMALRLKF